MVRIGLVGCGAWGIKYVDTLYSLPEVKLQYICDINEEVGRKIQDIHPDIITTTDYHELLQDDQLDGVIIATPPHSHFSIALDFLSRKKAVLLEKPFTLSCREADAIIQMAEKINAVIMVGHLLEYHPAVLIMRDCINQGQLGRLRYILMERASLGKNRNISAHWDLMVHDFSMIRYLINGNPLWISAHGVSYQQQNYYDLVIVTMKFPADLIVQIYANYISPKKKRKAEFYGDQMTMVFDDGEVADKLQLIALNGKVAIAKLEESMPLTNQCKHFLDCIQTKSSPRTGAADIRWVTKAAELVEQSLLHDGVKLFWDLNGGTDVNN